MSRRRGDAVVSRCREINRMAPARIIMLCVSRGSYEQLIADVNNISGTVKIVMRVVMVMVVVVEKVREEVES